MQTLGHRFREWRDERRLSQEEAARMLGITGNHLSKIERGGSIGRKTREAIFRVAGLSDGNATKGPQTVRVTMPRSLYETLLAAPAQIQLEHTVRTVTEHAPETEREQTRKRDE